MKRRPNTDPTEVALVQKPEPRHWLKVYNTYDEGCQVIHRGRFHWYRWEKIKKAR